MWSLPSSLSAIFGGTVVIFILAIFRALFHDAKWMVG
jgi:hypothetical protein